MTRLEAALAELAAAIREEVSAELAEHAAAPVQLLSIPEAARRLGISRTRLYAEMSTGRVRSVRSGRRRLVPVDALAALQDGG